MNHVSLILENPVGSESKVNTIIIIVICYFGVKLKIKLSFKKKNQVTDIYKPEQ